tara:strand:+ start:985 stop:1398 length:414 start_codon:yes stop_codon:yes gene_type:complete
MSNREIKFRAWDAPNNQMVYSKNEDCFYVNTKGVLFMYGIPKTKGTVGNLTRYHKSYDVMQYTGLKDKNGKEIYEGDVVRIKGLAIKGTDYPIIFDKAAFGFFEHHYSKQLWILGNFNPDDMEVIGNIYENPELIGE